MLQFSMWSLLEPGLRMRLIASPVSSWKVSHLQHPLILDCFPSILFRSVWFMYLWMFEKTSEEPIVFCCVLCFLYVSLSLCLFLWLWEFAQTLEENVVFPPPDRCVVPLLLLLSFLFCFWADRTRLKASGVHAVCGCH